MIKEIRYEPAINTNIKEMSDFMPPVLDEETGKITYFCVLCNQTKTAEADEPINFFFEETVRNYGETNRQGNCCPECFNKEH